jgi:DNA polymerase-3 subunit beta
MQIGYNSAFLTEMLTNLQSDMIMLKCLCLTELEFTPVDGLEEGETVTMGDASNAKQLISKKRFCYV